MTPKEFKKIVHQYYKKNARHTLPWRGNSATPYHILVSEVMLQQTQADRVVPKFKAFIKKFPTIQKLARASLREVLLAWQGLGYNRRALYLKKAAEEIVAKHSGKVPNDVEALIALPAIGPYTARAIRAFAWNIPDVFIETNIRTVFIHHFFPKKEKVPDSALLPFIEETLDRTSPKEWYAALMDYGSYLKRIVPNPSRRSRSHVKQGAFKGSLREARGKILRYVTEHERLPLLALPRIFKDLETKKVEQALRSLLREGMIVQKGKSILSQK
jgi:A/G-specific adenine glycosylase